METADPAYTGGPQGRGSIALSNSAEFLQDLGYKSESVPTTEEALPCRQNELTPNNVATWILPAADVDIMKNTRLAFDLEMEFDYYPQPLVIGDFPEWKTQALIDNNPIIAEYYPSLDTLDVYGRSIPDYALDFPDLIGALSLFERFTLRLTTGEPIDEMTKTRGYEWMQAYRACLLKGEELVKFDQAHKSNLLQWAPRIDPAMVSPKGVNGSLRATSMRLSDDGKKLITTQHIELPLPFYIGNDIWTRWWGGGHDLQLDVQVSPFNPLDNRAAMRVYSGYMNTIDHTTGWWAAADVADEGHLVAADIDVSEPVATLRPPILNYGVKLSYPKADGYPAYGIRSYLSLLLQSIVLDTSDLEAILGNSSLQVKGFPTGDPNNPNFTDRPACSFRNSGLTLFYMLSSADSLMAGIQPALNEISAQDFTVGFRKLRHNYCSVFIPAANISDISLAVSGGISTAELDAETLVQHLSGLDLTDQGVGAVRVRISFSVPIAIHVPIYNADYCPVQAVALSMTDPDEEKYIVTRMPWMAYDITPGAHYAAQHASLLGVKFGINYLACSNCPAGYDLAAKANCPSGFVQPQPVYTENFMWRSVNNNSIQALPDITSGGLPPVKMVNYPKSRTLRNVELRYQNPMLPPALRDELDAAYSSEGGEGLMVSRVVLDATREDVYVSGSRQINFELLGGSVKNPYFIWFALRSPNLLETVQPAYPVAAFSTVSLLQSGIEVLNNIRDVQLQCLGSMWPTIPSYLSSDGPNPNLGGLMMGRGGNSALMSRWAQAFGNTETRTDGKHPDASNFNASVFYRLGLMRDTVYGMNTLGGSASMQRQSPFKLTFTTMESELYRTGAPVPFYVVTDNPNWRNVKRYESINTENAGYSVNAPSMNFDNDPYKQPDGNLQAPAVYGFSDWAAFPPTKLFRQGATPLLSLYTVAAYRCEWHFKSGGKDASGRNIALVTKIT